MRRIIWFVCISLLALVAIFTMVAMQAPQLAGAQAPSETPTYDHFVFLPEVRRDPTFTPTPTLTPKPSATSPAPGLDWDPRLTLRQATFVPATVQPGDGYWKLVKAVWYDVNDTRPMGVGDHDIAFDVRNEANQRILGKSLKVSWWVDGTCPSTTNFWLLPEPLAPEVELPPLSLTDYCVNMVQTQDKGTEEYAGSYPMYHTTGTYRIEVDDGSPSDAMANLGMGTIEYPYVKFHTSYGLTWRWTTYYLFNTTTVPSCLPQAAGTWFEGKVYLHGQPANGYRVVFSSERAGPWASEPAITGPTPIKPYDDAGHYSHIIRPPDGHPIAGDWYVWIVNENDVRISAIATWHSDGPVPEGTGCNQAVVNFDS